MTRTTSRPTSAATEPAAPPEQTRKRAGNRPADGTTVAAATDPDLAATIAAKAPQSRARKRIKGKFVMPAEDYALIKLLKQRADAAGRPTRKNELLRAGLHALRESGSIELIKALGRLPPVGKRRKG